MSSRKLALIDLDGTLADYDGAMGKALEAMRSPLEEPYSDKYRNLAWWKARRDAIARVPGFWENLPPIEEGMRVLSAIQRHGFECMVLSKGPSSKSLAWAEKVNWCRKHIPDIPVCLTEDKQMVYGRVLFDDWPAYYQPWLDHRPRGLVICLARPQNEHIPDQYKDRVVRHDGSMESARRVQEALIAAYNR
jgi:5'-nucleotidase